MSAATVPQAAPEPLVVGGRPIPLDADGHLKRPADWSPAVGRALACREGVELGSEQWAIVELARDYYNEYHVAPGMRLIIALAARRTRPDGGIEIDSRRLYRWFGETPMRRICRYAGLPKPRSCI